MKSVSCLKFNMLDFIDKDLSGEKINPILKFLLDTWTSDTKTPKILETNVMLCRFVGLWIRPKFFKRDLTINFIILSPSVINWVIFYMLNIYENLYNFPAMVENMSFTLVGLAGIYMNSVFMANVKHYENIIENIIQLNQRFPIGSLLFSMEKKIRFGSQLFYNYAIYSLLFYLCLPYFTKR